MACALCGKEAYKYLDFAALATVADSVPLMGENRDIVAEGLKLINTSPKKCFSNFLTKSQESADAHTLAFTIAPKINAAGRMGDAASALALFSETDEKAVFDLSAVLRRTIRSASSAATNYMPRQRQNLLCAAPTAG